MPSFSILGPVEVRDDGTEIELPRRQQRTLLALLLLDANRVVLLDYLKDRLWLEQPPPSATAVLQNRISELRRLLGADVIETRPGGYLLRVDPADLDLLRFEALVARAQAEGPAERAQSLRQALGLWRGEPLADLTYEPCVADAIGYLGKRRLDVLEQRLEADLDLGRHADVVAELEGLVALHGERENLVAQLMRALSQGGRQAEAIRVYHDCRRVLDEQLGVLPGPALQQRYREVIRHDPNVLPPERRAPFGVDRHAHVVRALLAGRLVPVLGPSAAAGSTGGASPGPAAAAAHLAREFRCPLDQDAGLTRVAEWIAVTVGVGPLYDELRELYGEDYAPGPVHRLLARLPAFLRERELPCQLVVTTAFDCTLERAFADAGEEIDVLSYVALGRDRGKFLQVAPDGSTRVIDEPNVEVGLTTDERTTVLKVHGGALAGARDPGTSESYVVSEDDYIDYITGTHLAALLPVGLAARLSRSHFLFLGYELGDWSLRVFLRRLWGEERVGYRSWAVGPAPDPITVDYWRQSGVDTIDLSLDDYVQELAAALEDAPRLETLA